MTCLTLESCPCSQAPQTTYINYPMSIACPNNDGRPYPSFSSAMVMHLHVHAICLSYSCTPYTRRPYIQWWKASPFHAHWPWSHNRHMCAIVLIYAVRHTSYVCGHGLHPRIHITLGRKKGDTIDSSELSCVQARLVWLRHGRCASLTQ